MKLCELAEQFIGTIEVHELRESDGEEIWSIEDWHADIYYISDKREVINFVPINEWRIRVYVKEA